MSQLVGWSQLDRQFRSSVMFKQGNGKTRHNGSPATMTRRAVVTTAAAVPLSVPPCVGLAAAEDAVADLIKRAEEKNAAFMRGDMDRWARITRIAPDFTLMQPFGGPASHGFDSSPKRLAELAQYFRNGRTKLHVQTYRSQRLVVLVMIEQQEAEVG